MTSQKIFRLSPDAEVKVNLLIVYAHKAGFINKPTLQEFVIFAIGCSELQLRQHYQNMKNPQKADATRASRTRVLG